MPPLNNSAGQAIHEQLLLFTQLAALCFMESLARIPTATSDIAPVLRASASLSYGAMSLREQSLPGQNQIA